MSIRKKEKSAAFDVIVVGGGLSGMCAAIAAARGGAKVGLVHSRHVLGGNASSEIRMHVCGASSNGEKKNMEETGIINEIMLENKAVNDYFNFSVWDVVLYRAIKNEKNITCFFNTTMFDVKREGSRITEITCVQSTTETIFYLSASVFVDATGNGTLGYLAGAEYRVGSEARSEFGEEHAPEESNNERMGNTLLFKAIDRGHPVKFETPSWARHFDEEMLKYRVHSGAPVDFAIGNGTTVVGEDGKAKKDNSFFSFDIDYGYWWIELCGSTDDIVDEYEDIRDDLVSCIWGIWDHIKNGGDHGAENYDLEWVGMLPGVRESRRLVGDYILTSTDLLENKIFDDAVAYGGWPIDKHTAGGLYAFGQKPTFTWAIPGAYTIPYRSYCAKGIDNLMMAGRDISASKLAMSSTRVMGTCAVGGQAVGTAAALCKKYNCMPLDILDHIDELQQTLLRDDCYLVGVRNHDEKDFARHATVSATSTSNGNVAENVINGVTRPVGDDSNLWESGKIGDGGEAITLDFGKEVSLHEVRVTFGQDLSRAIKITLSRKRQRQQVIGIPPELVRDYTLDLIKDGKVVRTVDVCKNHQRQNILDFDETVCDSIKITVKSTNGADTAKIAEIRAY